MSRLMLFVFLFIGIAFAQDDEKPFVDHSFQCPLTTEWVLCDVVCVADLSECPDILKCEAPLIACGDGGCYANQTECDTAFNETGNPCEDVCGVACPQVYNNFSAICTELFGEFYAGDNCTAPYEISTTSEGFLFFYYWVSLVGGLSLLWCLFNQRLMPRGEAVEMEDEFIDSEKLETEEQVKPKENFLFRGHVTKSLKQIGYKRNIPALILYVLVIATIVGFQVLFGVLTAMFYKTEEVYPDISDGLNIFVDSTQALYVFEVAWMIGAAWCVLFKWPKSISYLFRRRCELSEADYVLVFQPTATEIFSNDPAVHKMQQVIAIVTRIINTFFAFVFSDVEFLRNPDGKYTSCDVTLQPDGSRTFYYNFRKFIYVSDNQRYELVKLSVAEVVSDWINLKKGLTTKEAGERILYVGPNLMDIPAPTVFSVLVDEFLKPFYLYQNFMSWTWFNFFYWHMGIVNTVVYVTGGLSISYVNYRNQKLLHSITKVSGSCQVLRDGQLKKVDHSQLVPGDVVHVTPGPVYCDMVLVEGSLLVDESSLTGESMPVAKTQVEPSSAIYKSTTHKKSTIFAGTEVLNSGTLMDNNLAVVTKTGSIADKGEFLRSILTSPVPLFKFDVEVKIVIMILCAVAIIGFCITLRFLDTDPVSGWFYAMYVVGTALPPLLPTVFVASVGIGSSRLRQKGVVCSNPQRILNAGKVRVSCFDKTGTLTKQGLDFHSVLPVSQGEFAKELSTLEDLNSQVAQAMACSHSLSKVTMADQTTQLIGNSVDIKMFTTTTWNLEMGGGVSPDKVSNSKLTLVLTKRFDFDHHRMTMGCFAKNQETGKHTFFLKGSAEAIKSRCVPSSIPSKYDEISEQFSRSGCYVLALASRPATSEEETKLSSTEKDLNRDLCEQNLNFIGLITFRNELKPDTSKALAMLREGAVRVVMITGDHPLTAIFIAKQCEIIARDRKILWARRVNDHGEIEWMTEKDEPTELPHDIVERSDTELVVTGEVFHALKTSAKIESLLTSIRVFARMSPSDKVDVVNLYVNLGFTTSMCGDGGNDCGALRAAHVGIALSDAEASVVSPFTGLDRSCMAVVDVLLIGRCSLASSFASYKYMIMYGQIETINQIINAWFSITFAEWNWVFMDGLWVVTMAFTLPFATAAKKLSQIRPTSSVLGPYTLVSAIGILILNIAFLILALGVLFEEDWFQCRKWVEGSIANPNIIGDNYESSVIYLVSGAQYFTSAMAFNFGSYHRAPWLFNWRFVIICAVFFGIHVATTMEPSTLSCFVRVNCEHENIVRAATTDEKVPIQNALNTTLMPFEFRRKIVGIFVANAAALMFWEYFVMNGIPARWFRRAYSNTRSLKL